MEGAAGDADRKADLPERADDRLELGFRHADELERAPARDAQAGAASLGDRGDFQE
jgi:hypothetical protein